MFRSSLSYPSCEAFEKHGRTYSSSILYQSANVNQISTLICELKMN